MQSPDNLETAIPDFVEGEPQVVVVRPPRRRVWLHALLFLLTCLTTLIVGARLQDRFDRVQPIFLADENFFPWQQFLLHPRGVLTGWPFAGTLLTILFAHEMGHFLLAVRNRVYATLPYFLPAPTPIGTFGAFILIKSRFRTRPNLFDIAIGGPIAGFVVAAPLAAVGLALSQPVYVDEGSAMGLGMPWIFQVLWHAVRSFAGSSTLPLDQILLHPIAIAAWVGMLATSLNLLPGGQLDGGHILFALSPQVHKRLTIVFAAALFVASYYLWSGWIIWTAAFLLTRRHPPVQYPGPMPASRKWMAAGALLLLLLTVIPVPFTGGGFRDVLQEMRSH